MPRAAIAGLIERPLPHPPPLTEERPPTPMVSCYTTTTTTATTTITTAVAAITSEWEAVGGQERRAVLTARVAIGGGY